MYRLTCEGMYLSSNEESTDNSQLSVMITGWTIKKISKIPDKTKAIESTEKTSCQYFKYITTCIFPYYYTSKQINCKPRKFSSKNRTYH